MQFIIFEYLLKKNMFILKSISFLTSTRIYFNFSTPLGQKEESKEQAYLTDLHYPSPTPSTSLGTDYSWRYRERRRWKVLTGTGIFSAKSGRGQRSIQRSVTTNSSCNLVTFSKFSLKKKILKKNALNKSNLYRIIKENVEVFA